ncbi:hypothetical protein HWV62_17521 [Athelia sp. TMB]|nr:hypothetical protein HWV62_17521 [Athelia sp. TMB]
MSSRPRQHGQPTQSQQDPYKLFRRAGDRQAESDTERPRYRAAGESSRDQIDGRQISNSRGYTSDSPATASVSRQRVASSGRTLHHPTRPTVSSSTYASKPQPPIPTGSSSTSPPAHTRLPPRSQTDPPDPRIHLHRRTASTPQQPLLERPSTAEEHAKTLRNNPYSRGGAIPPASTPEIRVPVKDPSTSSRRHREERKDKERPRETSDRRPERDLERRDDAYRDAYRAGTRERESRDKEARDQREARPDREARDRDRERELKERREARDRETRERTLRAERDQDRIREQRDREAKAIEALERDARERRVRQRDAEREADVKEKEAREREARQKERDYRDRESRDRRLRERELEYKERRLRERDTEREARDRAMKEQEAKERRVKEREAEREAREREAREQERQAKELEARERAREREVREREVLEQEAKERRAREREAEREAREKEAREQERQAKERRAAEREERRAVEREREMKERAAYERELREREARAREADRMAKEREAKEREVREREAQEREARELEAREREAREREALERQVKEREAQERAHREAWARQQLKEREAREREVREREAKEREARDREAREREAREREAREREAREREAKERETRERETKEREAREREVEEREARELEAREREAREREALERQVKEREAQERAHREAWARQQLREREAREREVREREAKEREAKEREAKEREAKEREAKEREAKEREAREREAREREARERQEREAQEREIKEREALARQIRDRENQERENREREAREREAREREVREREAREREAKEREAKEREAKERELQERVHRETREREAKEREARERENQERMETREREIKERHARERQAERELKEREARAREADRLAREHAAKEQQARELEARERQMALEAMERERDRREREAKERQAERETRDREMQAAREREYREREARERQIEREAKEQESRDREAKAQEAEKLAREREAKERDFRAREAERMLKEREAKEREFKEQVAREREAAERRARREAIEFQAQEGDPEESESDSDAQEVAPKERDRYQDRRLEADREREKWAKSHRARVPLAAAKEAEDVKNREINVPPASHRRHRSEDISPVTAPHLRMSRRVSHIGPLMIDQLPPLPMRLLKILQAKANNCHDHYRTMHEYRSAATSKGPLSRLERDPVTEISPKNRYEGKYQSIRSMFTEAQEPSTVNVSETLVNPPAPQFPLIPSSSRTGDAHPDFPLAEALPIQTSDILGNSRLEKLVQSVGATQTPKSRVFDRVQTYEALREDQLTSNRTPISNVDLASRSILVAPPMTKETSRASVNTFAHASAREPPVPVSKTSDQDVVTRTIVSRTVRFDLPSPIPSPPPVTAAIQTPALPGSTHRSLARVASFASSGSYHTATPPSPPLPPLPPLPSEQTLTTSRQAIAIPPKTPADASWKDIRVEGQVAPPATAIPFSNRTDASLQAPVLQQSLSQSAPDASKVSESPPQRRIHDRLVARDRVTETDTLEQQASARAPFQTPTAYPLRQPATGDGRTMQVPALQGHQRTPATSGQRSEPSVVKSTEPGSHLKGRTYATPSQEQASKSQHSATALSQTPQARPFEPSTIVRVPSRQSRQEPPPVITVTRSQSQVPTIQIDNTGPSPDSGGPRNLLQETPRSSHRLAPAVGSFIVATTPSQGSSVDVESNQSRKKNSAEVDQPPPANARRPYESMRQSSNDQVSYHREERPIDFSTALAAPSRIAKERSQDTHLVTSDLPARAVPSKPSYRSASDPVSHAPRPAVQYTAQVPVVQREPSQTPNLAWTVDSRRGAHLEEAIATSSPSDALQEPKDITNGHIHRDGTRYTTTVASRIAVAPSYDGASRFPITEESVHRRATTDAPERVVPNATPIPIPAPRTVAPEPIMPTPVADSTLSPVERAIRAVPSLNAPRTQPFSYQRPQRTDEATAQDPSLVTANSNLYHSHPSEEQIAKSNSHPFEPSAHNDPLSSSSLRPIPQQSNPYPQLLPIPDVTLTTFPTSLDDTSKLPASIPRSQGLASFSAPVHSSTNNRLDTVSISNSPSHPTHIPHASPAHQPSSGSIHVSTPTGSLQHGLDQHISSTTRAPATATAARPRQSPSRNVSNESILMTPSSLAPAALPKTQSTRTPMPPITRQESRESKESSKQKKGLFGSMFRPKIPAEKSHESHTLPILNPSEMNRSQASLQSLDKLNTLPTNSSTSVVLGPPVRQRKAVPAISVELPISRREPEQKVFSAFKFLHTKRIRTISHASVEVQDGQIHTATNTVVGSPTQSEAFTQMPFIPSPRDPIVATQEWRNREEEESRARPKDRRRRPGVVFDVADDGPPATAPPKKKLSVSRRRS